jgi:hypothetical protein
MSTFEQSFREAEEIALRFLHVDCGFAATDRRITDDGTNWTGGIVRYESTGSTTSGTPRGWSVTLSFFSIQVGVGSRGIQRIGRIVFCGRTSSARTRCRPSCSRAQFVRVGAGFGRPTSRIRAAGNGVARIRGTFLQRRRDALVRLGRPKTQGRTGRIRLETAICFRTCLQSEGLDAGRAALGTRIRQAQPGGSRTFSVCEKEVAGRDLIGYSGRHENGPAPTKAVSARIAWRGGALGRQ